MCVVFVKSNLAKCNFLQKNAPAFLVIQKNILSLQRNLRESFLKVTFLCV